MAGSEKQENAGTRDDTVSAQASADVAVASETAPSEQSTPYPRGRDRAECAARREASRDRLARSKADNEGQETRRGQMFKDKIEKKRQRMWGENPMDDQEESKSGNTQGYNFTLSKVEVE